MLCECRGVAPNEGLAEGKRGVRKCHRDSEMPLPDNKQERLGKRIGPEDKGKCSWAGAAGAKVGLGGWRWWARRAGRVQVVTSRERHAKELNLALKQ